MESKYNLYRTKGKVGTLSILVSIVTVLYVVALSPDPIRTASAGHEVIPGMVLVPAGKFLFGEKDAGTQEEIDLKAFYIDKYEVTNEVYKKFSHNHAFPADKANHPVTGVSWHEADTYCKAMGKRLPSEEEWEKAARGADGRAYPWGEEFDKSKAYTRESADKSAVSPGKGGHRSHDHPPSREEGDAKGTVSVGTHEAGKSPYGVHDMAGNAREWTSGWYDDKKIYRTVRGGSYFDDAESAFTFTVRKSIPEDAKEYIGFRCAK